MTDAHSLFATTPRGLEPLLAEELRALGAMQVAEGRAGVSFEGTLELAYRACLWSRTANRVLLRLATFPAPSPDALYEGVARIPWADHIAPDRTLAIDCTCAQSQISHSHFAALKTKDGIVDQLRARRGERPSIDLDRPDVRVNVYVFRDQATVAIDLSGESLHRRGYRDASVLAPLKENLAAAILLLAEWPRAAAEGRAFLDPMCGSGTLPIEAGLMATGTAPGLLRASFGFMGWSGHEPLVWKRLVAEAREQPPKASGLPPIVGLDRDPSAVRAAIENVARAGLRGVVHVERRELSTLDTSSVAGAKAGIVVVNPPYGERLGDIEELRPLYRALGDRLKPAFEGWNAFVLTGNPDLAKEIRLKPARRHVLFNGAIECRLFLLPVDSSGVRRPLPEPAAIVPSQGGVARSAAEGFANRLRKNLKHVRKWAKREGISCYRVYDADLPEYKVAIDVYERFAHVQEYAPPKTVDPIAAEARVSDVMALAPTLLGVAPEDVFLKVRRRQAGHSQYEKLGESGALHEVHEGGLTFLVNFTDHLDTGLFLDHRLTRRLIRTLAQGRHFLNLFAYTGAATVYAAAGGAKTTTTVDLSNTYLSWAEKNLAANRFQGREHSLIRADCLDFLDEETRRYGLIFLDPPTFSASKSMDETLDVQRDHVALLTKAARLLAPAGVLLFSNNFRRFRMHREELASLQIEDITEETLPEDFARSPRVHNAWRITRR